MPIVGVLVTEVEYKPVALIDSDRENLTLHFSNNSGVDVFVAAKYFTKDENSVSLLPDAFPIRENDVYTFPIKLTLRRGDEIKIKSTTPGVNVSLIK